MVMPCKATAEDVLEEKPDGVLLSPGPGDPRRLDYAVDTIRGLLGKVPVFGICLGSQLLGYSLGGVLYKLKFGHRGGNHPVRDEITGRIKITSQNHGYALDIETMKKTEARVSQVNLNDYTVEGLECPQRGSKPRADGQPGDFQAVRAADQGAAEVGGDSAGGVVRATARFFASLRMTNRSTDAQTQ
jgi:carbamoyl-phosphate synthase small subunit